MSLSFERVTNIFNFWRVLFKKLKKNFFFVTTATPIFATSSFGNTYCIMKFSAFHCKPPIGFKFFHALLKKNPALNSTPNWWLFNTISIIKYPICSVYLDSKAGYLQSASFKPQKLGSKFNIRRLLIKIIFFIILSCYELFGKFFMMVKTDRNRLFGNYIC